ncbi:DUF6180 family protein [Sphingomonas colocasiae]|uniref:DUF6180 family protein n=1 Tax=Sphingomonas colocasiae TaxID=1848973 RepID=A0ABS7PWE8_9SPHN|nr:DUF6180 family protein [Sphingomonas colocasiae]
MKQPLLVLGLVFSGSTAFAQPADFNMTYHVERTPAARLTIENCGRTIVQAA